MDREPAPEGVRRRLAIALDVDDVDLAVAMARELAPWFGVAKVGLELFSAAGPRAISALIDAGFDVFADLKLHDIPTTVERAAGVLGGLGARYVNFHAGGGVAMLEAALDGLRAGAARGGFAPPAGLAVTVLTSDRVAGPAVLAERVEAAVTAGCEGVVCAASDLRAVRAIGPEVLTMVPGIRFAGADVHDQARPATPDDALRAGADVIVIGRAVTAASDRRSAAAQVAALAVSGIASSGTAGADR